MLKEIAKLQDLAACSNFEIAWHAEGIPCYSLAIPV